MPSDSNGVYSLPPGYLAVTGQTIQASQHNPPLEDLAAAMTLRLMRSGAAPMTGALKIVDGSVGSPAVQFANGSSSGIYRTTNGIGVSVGGTLVAEFVAGGLVKGARYIGELIPYTGTVAPALTLLANGQTINRADYPDLWTFAQAEIDNGNTLYNNGNGSTTFGVPDLIGRTIAGLDSAATRLTMASALGATGGAETHTLTTAELAQHSHANTLNDPSHAHAYGNGFNGQRQGASGGFELLGGASQYNTQNQFTGITITNANAGSGQAHNNVQPTITTNFLIFAGA